MLRQRWRNQQRSWCLIEYRPLATGLACPSSGQAIEDSIAEGLVVALVIVLFLEEETLLNHSADCGGFVLRWAGISVQEDKQNPSTHGQGYNVQPRSDPAKPKLLSAGKEAPSAC